MTAAAVTLQVWRVPVARVPAALAAVPLTTRRLRRRTDVAFAKVLGTASPTFLPTSLTPRRWAILVCWRGRPDPSATPWWDHVADECGTLSLRPLTSRGTWDGVDPFPDPAAGGWEGRVVALTRASLRARRAAAFYRTVPRIARELRDSGCRLAFGIGEAPLLRQGTVSVWEGEAALRAFAYGAPAHVAAVRATPQTQWYAEELFTRFALVDASGSIDGTVLS